MLYPLSYEGLACTFAQRAGQVSVGWVRAGYPGPNVLCRICAACRGPASDPPPRTHGADCTARTDLGSLRPRAPPWGRQGETLRRRVPEVVMPFFAA
jgi:hypothetical protein